MSEEKDTAELDRLRSKKSSLEQQAKDCSDADAEISEKIKRLKKARDAIADCKSKIGSLSCGGGYDMEDTQLNSGPGISIERWRGDKRDSFENMRMGDLSDSLDTYHGRLDDIQDDMNNKINELQKSQFENEGLWGDIKSALYDVGTAIQNFFN